MFMALMERKYFDFFWHIYKKSNIKSKSMIELSQLYITPMWEGFMWVCGVCIGQYTCIVSILSIAYPKHSIEKEFSVKELPCSIIFKMVVTKRHVAIDQLCLCVPGTLYLYCADAMYTLVKDAFFRNKSQFRRTAKNHYHSNCTPFAMIPQAGYMYRFVHMNVYISVSNWRTVELYAIYLNHKILVKSYDVNCDMGSTTLIHSVWLTRITFLWMSNNRIISIRAISQDYKSRHVWACAYINSIVF